MVNHSATLPASFRMNVAGQQLLFTSCHPAGLYQHLAIHYTSTYETFNGRLDLICSGRLLGSQAVGSAELYVNDEPLARHSISVDPTVVDRGTNLDQLTAYVLALRMLVFVRGF